MTDENPIAEQTLEELASIILAGVETAGYQDIVKSHWASQSISAKKEKSGIKQVYIFIRPEYVVAEAIARQEDPRIALDDWVASINSMLAEVRKARREIALFDYSEIAQKLDWQGPDVYSHVYLAFARLFLVEVESILPVLSELEASSIPLLELPENAAFQFDIAVNQYRDELRSKDQYQKQCDQLANALAIEKQEKEKFNKSEAQNKKAIQDLGALNANILKESEAQASESKQLLAKSKQLSRDLEVQRQKTKQLTADIETLSAQLREEKDSRANVSKELEQAKKQLQQAERDLEKPAQESAELAEENELLLLQLHQVQEELEHYYLKLKEMEASQQLDDESGAAAIGKSDGAEEQSSLSVNQEKTILQKISKKLRDKKAVSIIRKSPLFDSEWYLEQYPDVAEENIDPAYHYYRFGFKEGRDPGPEFNTTWYLENYPDVYHADTNPLLHYIEFGEEEQRMKNPREQFPGH